MTHARLAPSYFDRQRATTRSGQHCRAKVLIAFRQQFYPSWNVINTSGIAQLQCEYPAASLRGRLGTLPERRAALQCP
jgi:hypothetical protein